MGITEPILTTVRFKTMRLLCGILGESRVGKSTLINNISISNREKVLKNPRIPSIGVLPLSSSMKPIRSIDPLIYKHKALFVEMKGDLEEQYQRVSPSFTHIVILINTLTDLSNRGTEKAIAAELYLKSKYPQINVSYVYTMGDIAVHDVVLWNSLVPTLKERNGYLVGTTTRSREYSPYIAVGVADFILDE